MKRDALPLPEQRRPRLPEGIPVRVWSAVGVSFLLALAATGLMMVDLRDPPDLLLFVGRFHPMIVHFPIGLILLAGIMEGIAAVYRPFRVLRYSTAVVLFLGSVSAAGAAVAGYLLSLEGGYDPVLVRTHMWLGIAVAIGSAVATLLKIRSQRRHRRHLDILYSGVIVVTVGMLLLAGHVGGSLTHGAGYLTYYLPEPLRNLLEPSEARAARGAITNIDSAVVYRDLIVPVFEARCTSCHNENKVKGRLRLDSEEGLLNGGDHGPVIVAGLPEESELLRRITLPPGHEEAMPPDGAPPLDVGETELIRWWIANGASFEHRVADIEQIPTSVTTLFARVAPPRPEEKIGVYALEAAPADPAAIAALRGLGFGIQPVAADVTLLQVTAVNIRSTVGDEELKALLPAAEQITWLDLGGTGVGDSGMADIAGMPNLTRLFLERTEVGDDGLRQLAGLRHLEYLNLHGTRVTDRGLDHLAGLERLRAVYLWGTAVTPAAAQRLRESREGLEVVLGTGSAAAESSSAR